jgi:hypothetical protein
LRLGLSILAVATTVAIAACSHSESPTTPTPVAGTTPPAGTTTTTVPLNSSPSTVSFSMPLLAGDAANVAFGLAPFGFHAGDHAVDGHAGWDIEYRSGAFVRAAADGIVLSVVADPFAPGRAVVQLEHQANQHFYRTSYSNLQSVPEAVVEGAEIDRGQVLGVAGSVSAFVGGTSLNYSMTHFQIDDFNFYAGPIANPNAVTPELLLSADGRALFNTLWPSAVFAPELTEPFATNPRSATLPMTRVWKIESGEGPAGVSFTRMSTAADIYQFAILAESGVAVESGNVTLRYTTRPLQTMDLLAATSTRLAVYDIVDDRMRLAIGAPGAPRPADLSGAAVYRTTRPAR